MKRLLFVLFMCLSIGAFAQDVKKEAEKHVTKMDAFASKTGIITKFIDYNLPPLKASLTPNDTRIRVLIQGSEKKYFYQIDKEDKYGTKKASVAYEDLLEIIKALQVLRTESEKDLVLNPDYLENKFVTGDGFQVGYYVSKGKLQWYVQLEKYGSGNSIFINDVSVIETAFGEAKTKIEEIKK